MAIDYMRPSCSSSAIVTALADFDVKTDVHCAAILSAILTLAVACDLVYLNGVEDFWSSCLCVVLLRALLQQIYSRSCAHRLGGHHVGLRIVGHPLCCRVSDGEWYLLVLHGFLTDHVLRACDQTHPGFCDVKTELEVILV